MALALRGLGITVWLSDADPEAARLAAGLGAGELLPAAGPPGGPADVAVLAVPPAVVASELAAAQGRGLARCYTDVASVKELPVRLARRAELRPRQLRARSPAVRARAVRPGGCQG